MKTKQFKVNTDGRDFVCGDLHGSLPLLEQFLKSQEFDEKRDRMFSVGDLVDRGVDSLGCLSLLDAHWFHCVKSNHEQLMEDFITGQPEGRWWMPNGGAWWNTLDRLEQVDIIYHFLPIVQRLPWLITVDMPNGKKFHVIHAELFGIKGRHITDADLADPVKFKEQAECFSGDGHCLLWGREMFSDVYGAEITKQQGILHKAILAKRGVTDFFNPELSHIFSGHTPMRKPTTILGQTNIDTMAFASDRHSWSGLTVVEPLRNVFWLSDKSGVREVEAQVL